ncbi:MAG: transposase, partial [Pseudomonadota bacterium]
SPETCNQCELKGQCTRAKDGRTLKRHERQDELDLILEEAKSRNGKRDIKARQHISERSFAQSTPLGLKRGRWRRVWRMQIQDFLIAAVQNITILIRKSRAKLSKSQAQLVEGRYDLETRKAGLFSKVTLWVRHGLWKRGYQPT